MRTHGSPHSQRPTAERPIRPGDFQRPDEASSASRSERWDRRRDRPRGPARRTSDAREGFLVGRIVRCLAVAVSAVGAAASLGTVATAQAATRAVTGSADSGRGTLRQALLDARDGDTVTIPAMTITLTSGQLEIRGVFGRATTALTIHGAGARSTIITANGHSRVLYSNGNGMTLSGVTITGGVQGTDNLCQNGGAGICDEGGDLVLINSSVRDNHATLQGNATLQSNVSARTLVRSAADGGAGIYSDGGNLILRGDTISGNQLTFIGGTFASGGGGIYSNGGNTTISNSTIADNSATQKNGTASQSGGGGLYSDGGNIVAASATIANNTAEFARTTRQNLRMVT